MGKCNWCGGVFSDSEFYPSSSVRCKRCVSDAVRTRRRTNGNVQNYDRERSRTPERLAKTTKVTADWRKKNPIAYKAQNAVNNGIRDGKLRKEPCLFCDNPKVHGHHKDYGKPLDVIWLCARCHHRLHAYFGVG